MVRSMTGFGAATRSIGDLSYTVEIRSVNSRYLKVSIRLPDLVAGLEADVDQRIRDRLHRGSIYVVMRSRGSSPEAAYEINTAALERYIEQLETLRPEQADVAVGLDLASLLALPGVCNPPDVEQFLEKAGPSLLDLVDEAIECVAAMRQTEGQSLAADLTRLCEALRSHLGEVARRAPQVVVDYHARLKRRVAELTASAELKIDEKDLAREVALFAERCDINEELVRLMAHIDQFRDVLARDDQPGRKLDFIAQEMLREANTIGSKANDAEITRHTVEMKTAIDRIKEQVQNVE